jgi:DNA repair protein RecN (Recombination protein N)
MLSELHIENFAVIKDANINLEQGINIISGEEGVGKSILVDSISTLIGSRAPASFIRHGAQQAHIEGIFWLQLNRVEQLHNLLQENGIELEKDGMLVISRTIQQQGRSTARINGRAIPLSLLREIGRYLIDIHGQMDYISLLDPHRQMDILDTYANLASARNNFTTTVDNLRQKTRELATFTSGKTDIHEELLRYQIEEIESADLQVGEDLSLQERRDFLMNAESLKESCFNAYSSLYSEEKSATVLIHEALVALKGFKDENELISRYREQLENTMSNLEDVARDLIHYGDSIESDAGELELIEQRLNLINSLKRKYGPAIEDINNFHAKAKAELDMIDNHLVHKANLEKEVEQLAVMAGRQAEELSLSRRRAAKSLVDLANEELSDLGLVYSKFDISLHREEDPDGLPVTNGKRFAYSNNGIDKVEFLISTNPGEPMKPLAAIASGGETCRIMLAMKSAFRRLDPIPTLIFDEIDIGIGGRSGDVVGKKLASLSNHHQVVCITHLPQIACFGDLHIRMSKDVRSGRASTKVETIKGDSRLKELAAMLGSNNDGEVMRDGADHLLCQAESWKKKEKSAVLN